MFPLAQISRVLHRLLSKPVYDLARSEFQIWLATRSPRLPACFEVGTFNLNAGAGYSAHEGWLNVDAYAHPGINFLCDLRKGFPSELAGRVQGIFCEHMFEHIDYYTEVPRFLASALNVLRAGGYIRLIVPDAEKYLTAYSAPGWDLMARTRPLRPGNLTPTPGERSIPRWSWSTTSFGKAESINLLGILKPCALR
jgi:hypothetical protein